MGWYQDARHKLIMAFPHAFVPEGFPKKPLIIGAVFDVIRSGVVKEQTAHDFFRRYCNCPSYLLAVAQGGRRINLEGREAGTISETDIAGAQSALRRIQQEHQISQDRKRYRLEAIRRRALLDRVRPIIAILASGNAVRIAEMLPLAKEILPEIDLAREPWAGRPPEGGGPQHEEEAA